MALWVVNAISSPPPVGFRDEVSLSTLSTPAPSPEEVQVTWSELGQEQQCGQSQQKELHGWKWPSEAASPMRWRS